MTSRRGRLRPPITGLDLRLKETDFAQFRRDVFVTREYEAIPIVSRLEAQGCGLLVGA